ncbi:hypothetical protein F2Q69_00037990, partial [Brassica cretica]
MNISIRCSGEGIDSEKSLLDEQGLRIAENQENSQKNRRKLAESTRDFKKASAEDKLGMFNSLLKGYQEEVDNITKRAKFGENAFLNIYQKLYEAPDPFPALASIAVQLSEKTCLLEKAEAKGEELTAKVNEQQRLIQKLEDDILKGYSSKERKGALFNEWEFSEAGVAEQSEAMDQKHVPSDQEQSSMLKVICSQRDRFRARLRETEEEIRRLKEKIGFLTDELEKTKADNVKLYGKIRYVQDYNHDKVVSRGSKKYVEDVESGFSSDVESKYKKIYEDDINPFAAFSKKEREQRIKDLGIRDRITLSSGRFLLGNKYARTFAFFYTIGLHVLVFTCLYRMSALSYLSHGAEETPVTETTTNLPR